MKDSAAAPTFPWQKKLEPRADGVVDIPWLPQPFRFQHGPVVRWIDFDGGSDANPGTQDRPWKHHPWDRNATGVARAETDGEADTFIFKRGVTYRGQLRIARSGTTSAPIRLTTHLAWGDGSAELAGSERITGWRPVPDDDTTPLPAEVRSRIVYADIGTDYTPRKLWTVSDAGQWQRLALARTPNWRSPEPYDPRSAWWEWKQRTREYRVTLEDAGDLSAGEQVTITLRQANPQGAGMEEVDFRFDVLEREDNCIAIRMIGERAMNAYALLRQKELRRGDTAFAIASIQDKPTVEVRDDRLRGMDSKTLIGATVWTERWGAVGIGPYPAKILSHDPATGAVEFHGRLWLGGEPTRYCRYFLENKPEFLDEPGEWWYAAEGPHAGRLYLLPPDGCDPASLRIEAARHATLIEMVDRSHVQITGLDFRGGNCVDWFQDLYLDREGDACTLHQDVMPFSTADMAAVCMLGSCSNVTVSHCTCVGMSNGVVNWPLPGRSRTNVCDRLRVSDCDFFDLDESAVYLSSGDHQRAIPGRLIEATITRNRVRQTGFREQSQGLPVAALFLMGAEIGEISWNVIDRTAGSGLWIIPGAYFDTPFYEVRKKVDRPVLRGLVYRNKVTNTMLAHHDFGGMATWNCGPSYVFNNISGDSVGYSYATSRFIREEQRTLEARSYPNTEFPCWSPGIYLDSMFKAFVFNNVIWGVSNDPEARFYTVCGIFDFVGNSNWIFNNTLHHTGASVVRSAPNQIFARGGTLANLMLDPGECFFRGRQGSAEDDLSTYLLAANVMHGMPDHLAQLNPATPKRTDVAAFQSDLAAAHAADASFGTVAAASPVEDAGKRRYAPVDADAVAGRAPRLFVPWGLYGTVGEWHFRRPGEHFDTVVGESLYQNEEWRDRFMYRLIPRNDLTTHGIGPDDYVQGILETCCPGALRLNGRDQYLSIPDAQLKSDYSWPYGGRQPAGTQPGEQRVNLDMDTNNLLVEAVLRTDTGGALCSKTDGQRGYACTIAPDGGVTFTLTADGMTLTGTAATLITNGEWHHLVLEFDRLQQRFQCYVDGKAVASQTAGALPQYRPLKNRADFLVGRPAGDGAWFRGELDFLRVCRGTLEDARTTIEELYAWQFDGPFLADFYGSAPADARRDVGAIDRASRVTSVDG